MAAACIPNLSRNFGPERAARREYNMMCAGCGVRSLDARLGKAVATHSHISDTPVASINITRDEIFSRFDYHFLSDLRPREY